MRPVLKGAGVKRSKLEYYILLSNVPFKFKLRRYSKAGAVELAGPGTSFSKCPSTYFQPSLIALNGILNPTSA